MFVWSFKEATATISVGSGKEHMTYVVTLEAFLILIEEFLATELFDYLSLILVSIITRHSSIQLFLIIKVLKRIINVLVLQFASIGNYHLDHHQSID